MSLGSEAGWFILNCISSGNELRTSRRSEGWAHKVQGLESVCS